MFTKRTVTALLLAAITLTTAACGDSGDGAEAAAPAQSEQPSDADVVGSWEGELTRKEAAEKGDSRLAGEFTLQFNADGTSVMSNDFDPVDIKGQYTVEGDQVTFTEDEGCRMGGFPEKATYRVALTGSRLRLTPIEEACGGRRQTLTYPEWEKVE